MKNKIYCYLILLVGACLALACEPSSYIGIETIGPVGGNSVSKVGERECNEEVRNVLLLYSAGYNSLSGFLADDINDLLSGELPASGRMDDVLLVYSHLLSPKGGYNTPTSPILMRAYKDMEGNIVKDTLVVYPEGSISSTASQLNEVLTYVKDNFPAKTYGMVFSSHATGYLPSGYYSNPKGYVYQKSGAKRIFGPGRDWQDSPGVPYVEPEYDPSLPMVKSVGQDQVGTSGNYLSYEIEIDDFAKAIPMYMDYILFDACLMGGVEVAYELSGKCGMVGFSQTEVLAEGFDYKTLTNHLLYGGTPDPAAVCMDYFNQYDIQSGVYRSATISLVDCTRMKHLAQVCAQLFDKYRDAIAELKPSNVQRYFRSDYHWFYDLFDIVSKAGADENEINELKAAIDECMVYKAATPGFMGSFNIRVYSGFSMYLPCNGGAELDLYYKTLKWNIDTGLVQ